MKKLEMEVFENLNKMLKWVGVPEINVPIESKFRNSIKVYEKFYNLSNKIGMLIYEMRIIPELDMSQHSDFNLEPVADLYDHMVSFENNYRKSINKVSELTSTYILRLASEITPVLPSNEYSRMIEKTPYDTKDPLMVKVLSYGFRRDIYVMNNDRCKFLSIDFKDAGYNSLRSVSDILPDTFENLCLMYNNGYSYELIRFMVKNTHLKRVVLGKLSPRLQDAITRCDIIKLTYDILKKKPDLDLYGINNDEIIFKMKEPCHTIGWLTPLTDRPLNVSVFDLYRIECKINDGDKSKIAYIKSHNLLLGGDIICSNKIRYTLHAADKNYTSMFLKTWYGDPLTPDDYLIKQDDCLLRLVP